METSRFNGVSLFRASNGRLHLVANVGKIPLADAMLIEDPSDPGTTDDDGMGHQVSA